MKSVSESQFKFGMVLSSFSLMTDSKILQIDLMVALHNYLIRPPLLSFVIDEFPEFPGVFRESLLELQFIRFIRLLDHILVLYSETAVLLLEPRSIWCGLLWSRRVCFLPPYDSHNVFTEPRRATFINFFCASPEPFYAKCSPSFRENIPLLHHRSWWRVPPYVDFATPVSYTHLTLPTIYSV